MNGLIGQKRLQTQKFREDGTRIPVTEIATSGNRVLAIKTKDKDGYIALQLGFGVAKKATKSMRGIMKNAHLATVPRYRKEIRLEESGEILSIGTEIKASEVFKAGDIVDVLGTSKGKGFAGGVKRHHFKGGPRTHGQSDRERAPGSIGQTTTPGRVYKGKRMAGRMGHETVTVKNLTIVSVSDNAVWVKGLVPGSINSIVTIEKVGEDKKFIPLLALAEETNMKEGGA